MRRLIAIVLMFLLPLQSAWALVAMPCLGHVSLPRAVTQAAAPADGPEAHDGHAAHGQHEAHDPHAAHGGPHGAHDAAAAWDGHAAHHDAAAAADRDDGSGGGVSASPAAADACSGSAACMSLHSPPLATGFDAGVPALALPDWRPPLEGSAFSSVAPQRLHRPPIGRAA